MSSKSADVPKAICGAITKRGTPCPLPAGFRTAHQGTGRCFHHAGPETKYYKNTSPTIENKAKEFANDPEVFSLRQEIGKLRAVLEERFERYQRLARAQTTPKREITKYISDINSTARNIGELVNKFHTIVYSKEYALTIEQVHRILSDVVLIFMERVSDPDIRAAIIADIRQLRVPSMAPPMLPSG